MEPDGRDSTTRPDGRQREPDRVLAWAPGLVDPSTAADPGPATPRQGRRKRDGLGELDVPVFPVSVTPPASWRRAAWFAVGASCAVLVGLVFAAGQLAEPDRIDAFPGLPTGSLLTAQHQGPPGQPGSDVNTVAGGTAPSGAAGSSASAGGTGGGGLAGSEAGEGPGGPTVTATRTSDDVDPPSRSQVPTVSVLPSTGSPPVGADELIDGAVQFYSLLPEDIDGAWQMVGPRVRAGGYEGFRTQWSDVVDVRLQEVVVDADESTVLATVEVAAADGEDEVRQYRMVFRGGGRPLTIEELDLVTQRGHKPQG